MCERRKRKTEGVSDATTERNLAVIKHLLTYADERGGIQSRPFEKFKKLREGRRERPRFTDQQTELAINKARAENYHFLPSEMETKRNIFPAIFKFKTR